MNKVTLLVLHTYFDTANHLGQQS